MQRINPASRGQTLETNIALLANHARVAAQFAQPYSALNSA